MPLDRETCALQNTSTVNDVGMGTQGIGSFPSVTIVPMFDELYPDG